MNQEQVKKLNNGIYRLYWKRGDSSLAAVGRLHDGRVWFAPINWVSEHEWTIASIDWKIVDHAVLYLHNDEMEIITCDV